MMRCGMDVMFLLGSYLYKSVVEPLAVLVSRLLLEFVGYDPEEGFGSTDPTGTIELGCRKA